MKWTRVSKDGKRTTTFKISRRKPALIEWLVAVIILAAILWAVIK